MRTMVFTVRVCGELREIEATSVTLATERAKEKFDCDDVTVIYADYK